MNKDFFSKFLHYVQLALFGKYDDYTKGSVNKALFILAVPVILEMAMESLFAIIDAFYIGQLNDDEAMATIGLTESFLFIIVSLALGVGMAATAIVARRIGEGKPNLASEVAFQAILLTIALSVIIGCIGFFYTEDLLRLMGADDKLIEVGYNYTLILLTLNGILMMIYTLNAIFRGAGDTKIAMWTLVLANGLNIILDPCLIFGLGPFPKLGLTGAAIATCIGRSIGILFQVYHLTNGKSIIKLGWKTVKLKMQVLIKIIRLTIGGAAQHLIASASFIFLIRIISEFGSQSIAGYTIAWRVLMFSLLPSWGIAIAGATLVGQNLGANQPGRAEESVWKAAKINMVILLILSLLFIVFSRQISSLFSQNDEVISQASLALQIICAGYIFYAYEMVIGQAFNGAGDTTTPTVLNFIAFWLVQIPLAYTLAHQTTFGVKGVYLSIAISSSLLSIMAIYQFRKGKWKLVNV